MEIKSLDVVFSARVSSTQNKQKAEEGRRLQEMAGMQPGAPSHTERKLS